MSIFKKNLSKKTKLTLALVFFVIFLLTFYIIWDIKTSGPLTSFMTDREALVETVESVGIFGPLAYILLQILQTVLAPIPGGVISPIGGFLFGWLGVLWTSIGATLGAWIVFYISKRYGRRLVEKIVKKEAVDKFDFILGRRAALILFLLFLIPGLPDDTICYVGGLTKVPIKTLLVIFFVGRLPAVVVNNYFGMGFNEGNYLALGICTALSIVLLAFIYWKQDWIISSLKPLNNSEPPKPPKK